MSLPADSMFASSAVECRQSTESFKAVRFVGSAFAKAQMKERSETNRAALNTIRRLTRRSSPRALLAEVCE